MLKLFDYECQCGRFEALVEGYEPEVLCEYGHVAYKVITAPAIHTLETHFRGMRADCPSEQYVPGHGSFRDENLCDKVTGEPQTYSSLKEKRALLEKNGLFEKGTKPNHLKRRKDRRMIFTDVGRKTSQQGVN